jgi:hypothetical protein
MNTGHQPNINSATHPSLIHHRQRYSKWFPNISELASRYLSSFRRYDFFQVLKVEGTDISKLAPTLALYTIGKRDGIIPAQLPGAWTSLGCYTLV